MSKPSAATDNPLGRGPFVTTVCLFVNEEGEITDHDIKKPSGDPRLDREALTAALKARFTPAYSDGVKVGVWVSINMVKKIR